MSEPPSDDPQVRLVQRIRLLLPDGTDVREVTMFGELAIMVDDSMLVCAGRAGDLLARVDPSRTRDLLKRPGATPAVMGQGRLMGPSWIRVSPDGIAEDAALAFWISATLERNRAASDGPR